MSADGLFALAEADVQSAVIDALRADAGLQSLLGSPARVFDDETESPAYPFIVLERHETEDAGASGVSAIEHRLTLASYSRHLGRQEAREILGALRCAIDGLSLDLPGQHLVHAYVSYADAMRTRDRRSFRGVLRARLIVEES